MEEFQDTKNDSLSHACYSKFLAWIKETRSIIIFKKIAELFVACCLCLVMVSPHLFVVFVKGIIFMHNMILLKFVTSYVLVKKRRMAWKVIAKLKGLKNGSSGSIESVSKNEILHFIFETGGFKLEESKRRLGIGLGSYNRITKKLEKIGVLVRGANNSRILNPDFSREQVRNILAGASDAKELSNFCISRDGKSEHRSSEDIKKSLQKTFFVEKI